MKSLLENGRKNMHVCIFALHCESVQMDGWITCDFTSFLTVFGSGHVSTMSE